MLKYIIRTEVRGATEFSNVAVTPNVGFLGLPVCGQFSSLGPTPFQMSRVITMFEISPLL